MTTDRRSPMKRDYTRVWFVGLMLFLVTEAAAIISGKSGRSLSAHVWRLQGRGGVEGALVYTVLAWLLFRHFPYGEGRPLGWSDLAAALAGLAIWYIAVYLRLKGGV